MSRVAWILVIAGILVMLGLMAWAVYATRALGAWTGGSWVLAAIIVGAALTTGALTAGLMWLAFYSARKGFDDRAGFSDD